MKPELPPPLVKAHLRDQIALIKQRAFAQSIKPIEHLKKGSLETCIQNWIKGLTPPQLSRMYGISEIIQLAQLNGRYRALPAKQMVATALYSCGFIQIRLWGKDLRNRRFWSYNKGNTNEEEL